MAIQSYEKTDSCLHEIRFLVLKYAHKLSSYKLSL